MLDSPLVCLTDLCKSFTKGKEKIVIFDRLNLSIPSGDFVAVMGPSGSGKTSLLNLIGASIGRMLARLTSTASASNTCRKAISPTGEQPMSDSSFNSTI